MANTNSAATQKCAHCGDVKPQELMEKNRRSWYCAYCYSTAFGSQNTTWIPRLQSKEELRALGGVQPIALARE